MVINFAIPDEVLEEQTRERAVDELYGTGAHAVRGAGEERDERLKLSRRNGIGSHAVDLELSDGTEELGKRAVGVESAADLQLRAMPHGIEDAGARGAEGVDGHRSRKRPPGGRG